jgi:hypothetical protein
MAPIVTTGFVKGGRFEMRNRKDVLAQLRRMKDCEVIVTIEPRKAARSQNQNRWYWAQVVGLVAEHTGYSPEEIHEIYKAKFLPHHVDFCDEHGEVVAEFVIGGSTTKLNKVEFGEYCERIRQWAAEELSVVIPDADAGALWPGARKQRGAA